MLSISKILITDEVHPLLIDGLERLGYQVDYRPEIKLEEVREIIGQYSGIVINTKTKMDRAMLERTKYLKFIARLGSGLDIIDLEEAEKRGIAVLRSPEGNANAVAEHVLGMVLALNNKILQGDVEVRNFNWEREKNRGKELEDSTFGIIGFGHTGSKLAEKLRCMNVKVLVYDKYRQQISSEFPFVFERSFEELLSESDYISLHVPLTKETEHMIRKESLKRCKAGVILINSSRGKVVNTEDLIEALEEGQIGGACLDVFENEKPARMTSVEKAMYKRLYELPNTIFTPHVAGWSISSKRKIAEILIEKISALEDVGRSKQN